MLTPRLLGSSPVLKNKNAKQLKRRVDPSDHEPKKVQKQDLSLEEMDGEFKNNIPNIEIKEFEGEIHKPLIERLKDCFDNDVLSNIEQFEQEIQNLTTDELKIILRDEKEFLIRDFHEKDADSDTYYSIFDFIAENGSPEVIRTIIIEAKSDDWLKETLTKNGFFLLVDRPFKIIELANTYTWVQDALNDQSHDSFFMCLGMEANKNGIDDFFELADQYEWLREHSIDFMKDFLDESIEPKYDLLIKHAINRPWLYQILNKWYDEFK